MFQLDTFFGRLLLVSIAILAASKNLLLAIIIIIIFIILNNYQSNEPFSSLYDLDTNTLLKQPSLKRTYRKKICDPRFALLSEDNKKLLKNMNTQMELTYPEGLCNPCSKPSKGCYFNITSGGDQLQAKQDLKPADIYNFACPSGTTQRGPLNADILGCGITPCNTRSKQTTIEQCRDACSANPECNSFTFAGIGGSTNDLDKPICTQYSQTQPTGMWGPKQLFCQMNWFN